MSLSFWANIGSIAGFLATLWTAWSAYRSKRYYLLVGRVPEQIEELQNRTSELAEVNNNPDATRTDRLRAIKHVRVSLESIARNIGWKHTSWILDLLARSTGWISRSDFADLKSKIKKIEQEDSLDPVTLDDIWAESEALAEKAHNIVRDSKFVRGS